MRIIGGIHKNRVLASPKGEVTRPTSSMTREAIFNICQNDIHEAIFLDLFAGVGAIGLEALSRGAKKAVFVEKHPHALEALKKNIETLQEEERSTIIRGDVFLTLAQLVKKRSVFDIIYADPPYGHSLGEEVARFIDSHPGLLSLGGQLFVEDEWKNQKSALPFTHLEIKSRRRLGKAELCQFVRLAPVL